MTHFFTKKLIVLAIFQGIVFILGAQPSNDECEQAIAIFDIAEGCSTPGAYSNIGATASNFTGSSCTTDNGSDVWFRFTAIATDLTLSVIGNVNQSNSGGTLNRPEAELYLDNNCTGTFQILECEPGSRNNVVELYQGGLIPGESYLVRIQGQGGEEGTFQLCINNYFPPVNPGSDLEIASILCDKSPFVIQQIDGTGDDNDEARGTCLDVPGSGLASEQSSTWFTWIAANDGGLTFSIAPIAPSDDLDFVVYELPNGINNPAGKIPLRCMASSCIGPTGLSIDAGDFEEAPGCDIGDDNFLRALDMERGKAYGLLINNFSDNGNGFAMEFGGSGEFQGPEPRIDAEINSTTNSICVGETVTYSGENSSFVLGEITEYEWVFGSGAEATTVTGPGPHIVTYTEPGEKSVVLTVTTNLGCKVSDVEAAVVIVEPCCEDNGINGDAAITPVVCNGEPGGIDLSVSSNSEITSLEWNTGATSEDLSNLAPGDYSVMITNKATCDTTFTFTVDSIPPFEIITDLNKPTCNGGTDGAIQLTIENGFEPIIVDFGAGNDPDRQLESLPAGDYAVTVIDGNGCEEEQIIELRELELQLDSSSSRLIDPTCFGFSDGQIGIIISNGDAPYSYDWQDGSGFVSSNEITGITAGTYNLEVLDTNLCRGSFQFEINQPEALIINLDTFDISCNGQVDGMVNANITGGTGDYTYVWSNGENGPTISNLPAGNYSLLVTDEQNCEAIAAAEIIEPASVSLSLGEVQDVTCFGDETGVIEVIPSGGSGGFVYSVDAENFQTENRISNLAAGNYTVTVKDRNECATTIEASINQPEELTVDAGEDVVVDLGYTTNLNATSAPFFRPVEYSWSAPELLNCVDCPNPTLMPLGDTTLYVTITDPTNCTATDSLQVFIIPNRPVFIPNAFTPNQDGLNDLFTIFAGRAGSEIVELKIFDRWGNMVYESYNLPLNEEQFGWNGEFKGQLLPAATYAFLARVRFIDDVIVEYSGDINLLR